jgi:toxin ParE1/3/4
VRAKRLLYTADALNDLRGIRAYIGAQSSPRSAAKMVARLRNAVRTVREAPLHGTPRPDYRPTCRFVFERPFVIYYDFTGSTLTVLRILHMARDRDSIMSGES